MRRCDCHSCRKRDARTFERIIQASFTAPERARLAGRLLLPERPAWTGAPVHEAPVPR